MEKKILGVCVWISQKTAIDVTWVRVGFALATLLGVGTPILIYLVIGLLLQMKWID